MFPINENSQELFEETVLEVVTLIQNVLKKKKRQTKKRKHYQKMIFKLNVSNTSLIPDFQALNLSDDIIM